MNKQYYKIELTLSKEYLRNLAEHPLLSEVKWSASEEYEKIWNEHEDFSKIFFGGKHGTQFTTLEELQSFLHEFNNLVKGFSPEHRDHLLYFMSYYTDDIEKQSIANNRYNMLKDYSDFLIDLVVNSLDHLQTILSNPEYKSIYDYATNETIYVKEKLLAKTTPEELIEYVPEEKNSEDIIRYLYIPFGKLTLQVPYDLACSITSERTMKSMKGNVISHLEFPRHFNQHIFRFTIEYMLNAHKDNNTEFYQFLTGDDISLEMLKKHYNTYHKHQLSQPLALNKVGWLISDYLYSNKLLNTKLAASSFIFKYFSLFKAFTTKKSIKPPADYGSLYEFYRRHNITSEKVREMLKDAEKFFGEISSYPKKTRTSF